MCRDPVYRLKLKNNYFEKEDIVYSNRDSRISDFENLIKYLCEKNYKSNSDGSTCARKDKI